MEGGFFMDKGQEVTFSSVEKSNEQLALPTRLKRKVQSKKIDFDGWGSKPLIEFLQSLGKETGKQLSQYEVTATVNEYISRNNLINPEKKRRVLCDPLLESLFRRKSVAQNRIYSLLESHYAENYDESEDELHCSEEKEEGMIVSQKPKASKSGKKVQLHVKQVPETPKSIFAAVVFENIKLVYLKRSVVQELLKDPENFETKVIGSYVRVKCDPKDYSQKNSHQLLQVTGVRKASECSDVGAEMYLQVLNLVKEILIGELSDVNFTKEECDDLCERVKAGSVKRPTIVELEEKAHILHVDITKHWIEKELALLQNLVDRANEKGWHREKFEYLKKKELLMKPSEKSRLLNEGPKVIAEDIEPEATLQDPVEEIEEGNSLPESTAKLTSADMPFENEANQTFSNHNICSTDAAEDQLVEHLKESCDATNIIDKEETQHVADIKQKDSREFEENVREPQVISNGNEDSGMRYQIVDHPDSMIWYVDFHGSTQGPYTMRMLKQWSDSNNSIPPGFLVWKKYHQPVLLKDVISQMYPS